MPELQKQIHVAAEDVERERKRADDLQAERDTAASENEGVSDKTRARVHTIPGPTTC